MEGETVWKQPLGVRCCKVKKQEESVCSVLSVDPRLRSSPCGVPVRGALGWEEPSQVLRAGGAGACSRPGSVGASLL